jgi:hypothetical protein
MQRQQHEIFHSDQHRVGEIEKELEELADGLNSVFFQHFI